MIQKTLSPESLVGRGFVRTINRPINRSTFVQCSNNIVIVGTINFSQIIREMSNICPKSEKCDIT
jgi:hypothetical protein